MKSRVEKEWLIEPLSAPLFIRRCSKCKKQREFYCSDKFRINAQKKIVDIWLIYKCVKCDNTCNINIFSRISPKAIDNDEYTKFQNNDSETAWKYAFDREVINSNKLVVDYDQIEYEIKGDIIPLNDIVEMNEDLIEFHINVKHMSYLKLSQVICQNFDITTSKMEKYFSDGIISVYPPCTVKKTRVKSGIKVIVNRIKLQKNIYNE